MLTVYYDSREPNHLSFPTVNALADWLAAVDDRTAIVIAEFPDRPIRIVLGDPRHGATVTTFTTEFARSEYSDRASGIREFLARVRAAVGE